MPAEFPLLLPNAAPNPAPFQSHIRPNLSSSLLNKINVKKLNSLNARVRTTSAIHANKTTKISVSER